ncbi:AraC family transcriptional regulator [Paenibacillus sp. J5C_2022]|uniref:AraC family transcriptional regulator n=1 Tax=Paenibacillus sp. J5C2022 TaxID=2977129 RepID=UPI0021CF914D|nr:AraC family transcriptional regulator [Paenibacillus sp. J5C2022]MCU6711924.1 AraC family transcriptional regulator [Paenibacillus sp. J5C2022]
MKTPAHRHDFVELTLVVSGKGMETINGEAHEMLPGTFVLLLPYQVHEIVSHPNHPLDLYICNFSLDLLSELDDKEWGLHEYVLRNRMSEQRAFVQLKGSRFEEIRQCFSELLHEYDNDHPFKSMVLKAHLMRAIAQYARSNLSQWPSSSERSLKGATNARSIWSIIHYIHKHYQDKLTLVSLSEQFRLPPSTLSEMFIQQYGIHFTDFLHELRVRHACALLRATDMPIADVAEESGFGSYSSFVRVFHKTKGLSPKDYRGCTT